jgi:PST family polysaccharide transporter
MSEIHGSAGGPDKHLRTDHLYRDLQGRAIRGGVVTVASQAVKVVAQFAAIVVLARLLAPLDFGLFAMIAAFLVVLETVKDLGLSAATIQRPDVTARQVSTLFWINVALAVLVTVVFAALAPVLAWFYGEPVLGEITPVVALGLLFTGLASQHLALLRRQMRFLAVAVIMNGADIGALLAAVVAALAGCGLWSLVIQRIVWAFVIAGGAWYACDWRPGRPGPFREIREMLAFGGNATVAMIIGRFSAACDKVLLGWYWGPISVGLFDRAQRLLIMPIQNLNGPLAPVALASLSRMTGEPQRYRDAYVAAAERLAMLVAPVAALMIAAAGPVIALVLGDQWSEAAPVLSWLGVTAIYMPLTYTLTWLYLSQDRTGEMLRASLVNSALTLPALLAGLPWGATGVAMSYAVSGVLLRVPVLLWLASRRGPVGLRQFVRVLALPTLAAGIATGLIFALRESPYAAGLSDIALALVFAVVAGTTCLAVYAAVPHGRTILRHTARLPAMMMKGA